jgi:TolB-like protein/DNA-binding winged helix-turn-helix (wHTH) protein/Flp pilus assembly protein TadD
MPNLVHFDCFDVDLSAGRLYKHGIKIRLRDKSFQVLVTLLEHPREVVTREDLRRRLWREEVFVDFDNNLNTAIARLREALNDSADHPRFIETLPKRGYRFIGPVDDTSTSQPGPLPCLPEPEEGICGEPQQGRQRRYGVLVAAALVGAMGLVFVLKLESWRDWLWRRTAAQSTPVHIESLAVLPLENLSGNPDEEYFADGMTEALITELGKVHALRVISRQSVMHYKGTKKTLPQIAKELNVDGLVEGSAVRAGGKVWITAQLIQAAPERHVWSESYERKLSDVIALQRELSQAIVGEIQGKLASPERAHLINAPAVKPEAYEDYLRGRYHFERRTGRLGVDEAISYFQQAVAKDATYAPAYAWLARCYAISGLYHPPKEVLPKARAAAMKALEIDDTQAEAHASLGFVKAAYDWDWQGAEREFNRAIELDPNNSSSHSQYVWYLGVMGRFDEAIAEAKGARVLDPFSVNTNRILGWAYLHARRYDEAIDQFKKTLELDPNYSPAQIYLADCYLFKGMYPEALALLQKLRPRGDESLAYLYGVMGQRSKALRVIEDLKRRPYIDPIFLVFAYAGVGDHDNAIRLLNKGYAERSPQMPFLKVEPFFDPLRADPRFQDLLRRMNFPP